MRVREKYIDLWLQDNPLAACQIDPEDAELAEAVPRLRQIAHHCAMTIRAR
jgi:hypothetical protein